MPLQPCDFVLSFDALLHPLPPEQYHCLFARQHDFVALAAVAGENQLVSKAESAVAPRDECDRLAWDHSSDPRRRAALSIVTGTSDQQGSRKRQRPASVDGAVYPQRDPARRSPKQPTGVRINQSYAKDLSYAPPDHPLICKQSCTYTRVILASEGAWHQVWKV